MSELVARGVEMRGGMREMGRDRKEGILGGRDIGVGGRSIEIEEVSRQEWR